MNLIGDVENEALFREVQLYAGVARYDPSEYPAIKVAENDLHVSFKERNSNEQLDLALDAVVLATPYKSAAGTKDLAMQLKVPVTQDGFMLEAHVKLRPVDFATEGIFVAGGAQWPKSLEDAIMQGLAASGRVVGLLAKGFVEAEGITAEVNEGMCIGCRKCEKVCPYNAIEMVPSTMEIDMEPVTIQKARIINAMCKGCGTCAASCPTKAIDQRHFKNSQVLSMIKALFDTEACACREQQSVLANGTREQRFKLDQNEKGDETA
jgi:heterodisulfide reductase subunit A